MINEYSLINKNTSEVEMEDTENKENIENNIKTKEGAQNELFRLFGLKKTSDFQQALKTNIELVEKVINYIKEKKSEDTANFPQYDDKWLKIRGEELDLFNKFKSTGELDKIEFRSKEDQEKELKNEFGFYDTKGFLEILKTDISEGRRFVKFINDNKYRFIKYLATFDEWNNYCQDKITEAEKNNQ